MSLNLNEHVFTERGMFKTSADGCKTLFEIPHNIGKTPRSCKVFAKGAGGEIKCVDLDMHFVYVHFQEPPPEGIYDVKIEWYVEFVYTYMVQLSTKESNYLENKSVDVTYSPTSWKIFVGELKEENKKIISNQKTLAEGKTETRSISLFD